jgi:site-specific DNA-methyltransferase (adenine-specific)
MQYYQSNNGDFTLIKGDTMQELPNIEGQFDMIFADPPYFISGGGKTIRGKRVVVANFGDWDKIRPDEEKDEFNMQWLKSCRDLLKPNGTIWVSGTFHNIYSVGRCLTSLGYKILNVITWQKIDPPPSLTGTRFNFASEYIIWAAKSDKSKYYLNFDLMTEMNGGKQMSDVWRLPSVGMWEKKCGKHPTQKPLRLLYRIILACTHEGDRILDPFSGSCTTGIAASLLGRKFVGIDMSEEYLQLGIKRRDEISNAETAEHIMQKMRENPEEVSVLVNHARKEARELMIEKGICYMRAGDSGGSLQVTPGFERMRYVLLHTNGENAQLFPIQKGKEGKFSIWTKQTLEKHGFHPEHADYYIVIPFVNKPKEFKKLTNLKQRINTYLAKVRPLSDFTGIK